MPNKKLTKKELNQLLKLMQRFNETLGITDIEENRDILGFIWCEAEDIKKYLGLKI